MKPLAVMLSASLATTVAQADTITVHLQVKTELGNINVAAFKSQAAFDSGNFTAGTRRKATIGKMSLVLEGLTPGAYGIVTFQDYNGNGVLDRNALGVPTEPFGFAKNPRVRFKAPTFQEFAIKFSGSPKEITIQLN